MERKKQQSKPLPQKKNKPELSGEGEPSEKDQVSAGGHAFAKYTGLAFQLIAIILIFYWAGSRLDERAANDRPYYTAVLSLIGVVAGLYLSLKDFIRIKK